MANELELGASVVYQKGNTESFSWSIAGRKVTVSASVLTGMQIVSVGTSEEVIPLGESTAAGALFFGENLDDTNYLEIRDATGASNDVVQVRKREPFLFRFGSDVTAPYWIANTAAVLVRFGLIPL